MENRDRKFQIRMTQTEFEWLEKQAAAANMNKTRYLTYLVEREEKGAAVAVKDGETPPILVFQEGNLWRLRSIMLKWGNNLNQATHALNTLADMRYGLNDTQRNYLMKTLAILAKSNERLAIIQRALDKLIARKLIVIDRKKR